MQGCFKVWQLMNRLRALGCRPLRTPDSHQVWVTPAGRRLTIVVNHLNADVTHTVLFSVKRVLRSEGLLLS